MAAKKKHVSERPVSERKVSDLFHSSRIAADGSIKPFDYTPGGQVRSTEIVKQFADRFRARIKKDPDDVSTIIPVIKAVKRLKQVTMPYEAVRDHLYAKRTATDILSTKSAVVLSDEDRAKHKNVLGCVDYGIALTATLKELGIMAQFARTRDRTVVFFRQKYQWYYVDPSRHTLDPTPQPFKRFTRDYFTGLQRQGKFKRGRDAWDIGITGLEHFDKYC